MKKIRVLVADGADVAQLAQLLQRDSRLQVVGTVTDGNAAVEFVRKHKPDVVLMDVDMPRMDGFEATRRIMEEFPVPIIICSAEADPREMTTAFRTMEAGAVSCMRKPGAPSDPQFDEHASQLVQTVKLMSEVKVVRRWPTARRQAQARSGKGAATTGPVRVIGIGASTGGPPVVQSILAALPKEFAVPVLVVQHISHGFLPGLIDWLSQTTGFRIVVASHGARPLAGHVYLAPDDFHMGMKSTGHLFLSREKPEHGVRPSVSFLFRSLAEECQSAAIGVLLSGMGKDGAAELKAMKDAGATTIAQDRESSVIHGMPGAAIEIGGATHVLPADRISEVLVSVVKRRNGDAGAGLA